LKIVGKKFEPQKLPDVGFLTEHIAVCEKQRFVIYIIHFSRNNKIVT